MFSIHNDASQTVIRETKDHLNITVNVHPL